MKKYKKCGIGLTMAIMAGTAYIAYILDISIISRQEESVQEAATANIPQSHEISYKSERNYRQNYNGCGPFSAAAAMRALGDKTVDSREVAKTMPLRIPRRKSTLPKGIELYLTSQGYVTYRPKLTQLSDNEKLQYLQSQLAQNKPIILLGDLDGYQHYLIILGYNQEKQEWYLYDSIQKKGKEGYTIDQNGETTGNTTRDTEKLLTFRSGGGSYGLYEYYALIISKE